MTTETIVSYRAWKAGKISKEQYLKEVLKAGGDAGITGTATTAAMIPIQATITAAGISSLLTIPVTVVLGAGINSIVAPCFERGKYQKILNEAKYYQAIEDIYDDFIIAVEKSANQYMTYINQIQLQTTRHNQMKQFSKEINHSLKDLYNSI